MLQQLTFSTAAKFDRFPTSDKLLSALFIANTNDLLEAHLNVTLVMKVISLRLKAWVFDLSFLEYLLRQQSSFNQKSTMTRRSLFLYTGKTNRLFRHACTARTNFRGFLISSQFSFVCLKLHICRPNKDGLPR